MQFPSISSSGLTTQSNRVLRNTYWLLALSMVPTVAGAWFGLSTGILHGLGSIASTVLFLVGSMGLIYLVERNKDSAAGVPILMGFTFFMGLMLSRMLGVVLSMHDGASVIMTAGLATGGVFVGMAALSSMITRDLQPLGKVLFIGAIVALVLMLANLFIGSSALALALSAMVALVFSLFVLVDLKAVRDGYQTNYISATLNIYLDLYNVFTSLMHLTSALDD